MLSALKGYLRDSAISRANQQARLVYSAASLALTQYTEENGTYLTKSLASPTLSGDAREVALQNGLVLTLKGLDGQLSSGYYAFVTNRAGTGIEYALWSREPFDEPLQQTSVQQQAAFTPEGFTVSAAGLGCYPVSDVSDS